VYRSPALEAAEVIRLYEGYEGVVFNGKKPDDYFDHIVGLPLEESENAQKVEWLRSALDRVLPGRGTRDLSVLDVGCGGGTLLYTLNRRFGLSDSSGVERNRAYADLAARRAGILVSEREYRSGLFGRCFDLVVNTKVLEHVPEPEPFVRHLAADVAIGGALFIEVPDVSEVWSLPPDSDRFFIPHVYFFSANTLGELLGRAGLVPVISDVVSTRGRSYLRMLAVPSQKASSGTPPFDEAEEIIRRTSRLREAGDGPGRVG